MSGTGAPGRTTPGRRLAGIAVAVATALVIAGVAIALFFNPIWVSFAQGRADAAAWTGWTAQQVDAVTRDPEYPDGDQEPEEEDIGPDDPPDAAANEAPVAVPA